MHFTNLEIDCLSIIHEIKSQFSLPITIHDHEHLIIACPLAQHFHFRHDDPFCEWKRHEQKDWFENCRKCCLDNTKIIFKSTRKAQLATCWKNAEQIIHPVFDNNNLIFTIFAGPFRITNHQLGKETSNMYSKLTFISKEQINQINVYIHALSATLLQLATDIQNIKSSKNSRKNQIEKFINKNYSQCISLTNLANHLNLSLSRTSHVLKEEFNLGFNDLLLNTRILKAKLLLLHSDLPISEIAHKVGFPNNNYFFVCFKKTAKISPKNFREKFKNSV